MAYAQGANSVGSVLSTCKEVMACAESVSIDQDALANYAAVLNTTYPTESITSPYYQATEPVAGEADASPKLPQWVADDYHFRDLENPTLTAQYVLVLDALNFCFWPAEDPGWEYDRLASTVKAVAVADGMDGLSAETLAAMTDADVVAWFGGTPPPRTAARTRALNEVGRVLLAHYDGLASNLIAAADGSAVELVARVVAHFPAFRDEAMYRGNRVYFYKRAQILVGDIWGAFGGVGLGSFSDIGELTMFADYRIPQLLRELGILVYTPELAATIDALTPIPAGAPQEVEIRAATVVAVDSLRTLLAAQWTTVQLDWHLWEEGEAARTDLAPHHRTLTIFY